MESRTPVLLTGVRIGTSRVAGGIPLINNIAGVLHSHQVHSTMMTCKHPYTIAPKLVHMLSAFGLSTGKYTNGVFIVIISSVT